MLSSWAVLLGIAAGCATFAGGQLVLRARRHFGSLVALAAGMVIGVALFDLLPEALEIGNRQPGVIGLLACTGLAVAGYGLLDRLTDRWLRATGGLGAVLGPASLTLHSLIDGAGIGLAFRLNPSVGWLVSAAVITHDLADGINTVSLALSTGTRRAGRVWLLVNAIAPVLGVLLGSALHVPKPIFAALLACFAGVFLHIGGVILVPRSHALRPRPSTRLATLAGSVLMLCVVGLVQHLR